MAAEYQNDLKPDRDEMFGEYEYRGVLEYHGYELIFENANKQSKVHAIREHEMNSSAKNQLSSFQRSS